MYYIPKQGITYNSEEKNDPQLHVKMWMSVTNAMSQRSQTQGGHSFMCSIHIKFTTHL